MPSRPGEVFRRLVACFLKPTPGWTRIGIVSSSSPTRAKRWYTVPHHTRLQLKIFSPLKNFLPKFPISCHTYAMKLGIDFYGTITNAPQSYRKLAQAVLDGGGQVHIISAIAEANESQLRRDVTKSRVPHTQLHVVTYREWHEVPSLKRRVAQDLELDAFIDDREDTLRAMNAHGILALHS